MKNNKLYVNIKKTSKKRGWWRWFIDIVFTQLLSNKIAEN